MVYLEFIELNFCGLNVYTRRNIKVRSDTEIIVSLDDITENSETNDNNENNDNNELFGKEEDE